MINDKKFTLSDRFLIDGVAPLGRTLRSVSVAIRLKRCIRSRTLSCSADDCGVVGISSSYFFCLQSFFSSQFYEKYVTKNSKFLSEKINLINILRPK